MTRINTNVSSLNAQKTLARSNAQLQQALTRLSTGLQINSGKDDPAGLIASETLKADITSTNKAISNSQRANQLITTADSALGQISSLLNDIRGLVSEAANKGAMSAEQIAANQLQIDSSLEAIDRIARVTSFQGKRLLDGNLDFTTAGVSTAQIADLQIDQATFGTQSQIGVAIDVVAEAKKGSLTYNSNTISDNVVLKIGGSEGFEAFSFEAGSSVSDIAAAINLVSDALGVKAVTGSVTATESRAGRTTLASNGQTISIQANKAGKDAGEVAIEFVTSTTPGDFGAVRNIDGDKITVTLEVTGATTAATTGPQAVTAGGDTLAITAANAGSAFSNVKLNVAIGAGPATASYDYKTNTINAVLVAGDAAAADLATVINDNLGDLFTAAAAGATGDDVVPATANTKTFTGVATDGGELTAANSMLALKNALDALVDSDGKPYYTTTLSGDGSALLNKFAYSGIYGQENVGLGSDPNNGIQFLGIEGSQVPAINFVKSGTNQPLSITYTANAGTDGYATAYLQGVGATVKIVSTVQGMDYDGVTILFANNPGPTTAVFDKGAKTLTINYDTAANGDEILADDLAALINTTGLFEASVIGDGATGVVSTSQTAQTTGGNLYSSININLATDSNGAILTTAADVINAINGSAELRNMGITAAHLGSSDGSGKVGTGSTYLTPAGVAKVTANASGTTYAAAGNDARLTATAKTPGSAYDNVKIKVYHDASVTAGVNERVVYDANKKELAIYVQSGASTVNDVLAQFTANHNPIEYAMFSLTALGSGDGVLTAGDEGLLSGGVVNSGTPQGAISFVENFDRGDQVGENLEFVSTRYGSSQFVSVTALKGTFRTYNAAGEETDRDEGKDINLRINGISAVAEGLDVSFNTSSLDMRFTMNENVLQGTRINFSITGGGAQFQLGPDVLSNQQARIGIASISTVQLGGNNGRLYELRSGGSKALDKDAGGAAAVVDEVITQITTIRGRLGAFQKTTLDTNIAALTDTVEVLTQAQSEIADTDFAVESAKMTRANILVQSGLTVLSTANQNPQQILRLLQQ
jgi:flagellin